MQTRIQRNLLVAMEEIACDNGLTVETRVCPFLNGDVPKFLEQLRGYEEWSRKTGGKTYFKSNLDCLAA